ncbi:MAG TPA: Fur family transcriptional regulator [Syntrophomonadaceae bacterium]|nr:Fur family transcriptional regulator [Syntrophomonadaceae bacterium]HPR93020.1 Fur family transcriptional regulator [Syntrophomonadaceae bacterium]
MNDLNHDITEMLVKKNIKPSYQRIKILEYLAFNRNHPTVEQIFHELVEEIPTLSKTTVYNSINLFIDAGIVIPINIEDHEIRYDYETAIHGHFKCIMCSSIYDFPIEKDVFATDYLKNYAIKDKNVYCKGICPACLENKN